jgi:hypothetical protein
MASLFTVPGHLDHCEENYAYHSSIAEFWNTISCASIFVLGVIGILITRAHFVKDWR